MGSVGSTNGLQLKDIRDRDHVKATGTMALEIPMAEVSFSLSPLEFVRSFNTK